mgnify:FL=1
MESKDIKIWGSIQIYTPFNFEHKKNRNFMKRLHDFNEQEIAIGFYDNEKKQMLYKNKIRDHYEGAANTATARMFNNIKDNAPEFAIVSPINFEPSEIDTQNEPNDDFILNVYGNDNNNFQVGMSSRFYDNLQEFGDYYSHKIEYDANVYGEKLVLRNINYYILFPIGIVYQDAITYLNVNLEIFSNGMCILKTDIPIEENNINDYYDNNHFIKYDKIQLPRFLINTDNDDYKYEDIEEQSLHEIIEKYYMRYISKYFKMKLFIDQSITSMIITDKNISINTLNNIPKSMEEALYRVLNSPVDPNIDIKEQSSKLKNSFWGFNQMRVYVSSKGSLLSITSNDVLKKLSSEDISISRSNLKFTLEHAMDIPLKIIILKRINNTTLFNETAFDVDKSEKLKEVYSINNIFLLDMKEWFYGSALELIEFFEEKMKWYLNEKDMTNKINNIQSLIENKKRVENKIQSNYLSIISFIITLVFALPTLIDTFIIILTTATKFDNEKIKAVSNDYGYKSWIAVIIIQIMIVLFFKRERFNYYKNKVQISVKKFTHILNNNKYSKHIIKYYLLYVMSIAIIWIIFQRFL